MIPGLRKKINTKSKSFLIFLLLLLNISSLTRNIGLGMHDISAAISAIGR